MSRPISRLIGAVRAAALVVALVLFSTGATRGAPLAQDAVPVGAAMEFTKWALTQGGLVVVVLVILWSYRRDFTRVLAGARAENAQLLAALQATTAAMTAHAETMRQQTATLAQQSANLAEVAKVIEGCRAVQRLLEGGHE